jgi:hypothetical protein
MTEKYIQIEEWYQVSYNRIRIRFSKPVPYLVSDPTNSRYLNSALNLSNYELKIGTVVQTIHAVHSVRDHYDSVDVEVAVPLTDNTYILTVSKVKSSPTYEKQIGDTYFYSSLKNDTQSVSIACKSIPASPLVNGKSSVEENLRKYMSPMLDGPNFRALLTAFANGESWNKENARLALNQLFVSTASAPYLDRLAASYGITRSTDIALGDSSFRQYVVRLYTGKLTEKSLYDMLELFYGLEGVCAKIKAIDGNFGTVTDNSTLILEFDGNIRKTINFLAAEFTDPSSPSADEIAVTISRKLREQNVNAFCTVDHSGLLYLFSGTKGLRSSVEVIGGTAVAWTRFPVEKNSLVLNPNASFIGKDADGFLNIFLPAISTIIDRDLSNATYLSDLEADPVVDIPSGYAFDTESRFALTDVEETLTVAISRYSKPGVITVSDGAAFGTGSGYLVLNYGFDNMEGPIAYTHIVDNMIYIDPSYRFQFKHEADSTGGNPDLPPSQYSRVTKLNGNVGYQGQYAGSFYLTNTNAAWAAAKSTLTEMLAAGIKYKFDIVYPPEPSLPEASIEYMYAPNGE